MTYLLYTCKLNYISSYWSWAMILFPSQSRLQPYSSSKWLPVFEVSWDSWYARVRYALRTGGFLIPLWDFELKYNNLSESSLSNSLETFGAKYQHHKILKIRNAIWRKYWNTWNKNASSVVTRYLGLAVLNYGNLTFFFFNRFVWYVIYLQKIEGFKIMQLSMFWCRCVPQKYYYIW